MGKHGAHFMIYGYFMITKAAVMVKLYVKFYVLHVKFLWSIFER